MAQSLCNRNTHTHKYFSWSKIHVKYEHSSLFSLFVIHKNTKETFHDHYLGKGALSQE